MEFSTKQLSDTEVEIKIQNTAGEVTEAYKEAYLKARAKFKAPGFRVGKAPLELIEKQLGDSVAEDAANILVNKSMQDIIPSLAAAPVNTPFFSVEKFDKESGASYTGKFEIIPEIKNLKHKNVKVEKAVPSVSDATVQEELETLRKKQAVFHPREDEGVKDGDTVVMDITIKRGKKVIFDRKDAEITAGTLNITPGMNGELLGMKAGEKKVFSDRVELPEGDAESSAETSDFEIIFNVKNVGFLEYPELNDEFARDMGDFENLSALKARIREDYINLTDLVLKQRAQASILDQIVADTKIPVPSSMVNSELDGRLRNVSERIGQTDLTMESLAEMIQKPYDDLKKEWTEGAERFVKEQIILFEIARIENISVTPEEIRDHIIKTYSGHLDQAGFEKLLRDRAALDRINDQVLFRKVFDFLYENAEIKSGKEISYETLKEEGAFSEN